MRLRQARKIEKAVYYRSKVLPYHRVDALEERHGPTLRRAKRRLWKAGIHAFPAADLWTGLEREARRIVERREVERVAKLEAEIERQRKENP